MPSVEAINSQIEILEKRIKRMEHKLRKYFEETDGNPDPGTVTEYNRIMEVDAINRERLKKELELKEYESQFSEIDSILYKRGKKYRNENLEQQKDAYFSEISKIKKELKKLESA